MSAGYVFQTCTQQWGASIEDLVIVKDESNIRIGTFPMTFLNGGAANTSTVQYLLRICMLVLDVPPTASLTTFDHRGLLDVHEQLCPGTYRLNGTFEPRPGPSGKTKSKPFTDFDSPSTVSMSSRSTENQNYFKMDLCLRDGRCPVSGEYRLMNLVACHIVPFSLGQSQLDEICGHSLVGLFSISNGLLLAREFNKMFDRYLWSIYTFEGSYYVHIFGEGDHELHGKKPEFREPIRHRLPSAKLLEWHYTQCLMARFRGSIVRSWRICDGYPSGSSE